MKIPPPPPPPRTTRPLEVLLSCLANVKPSSGGWRADCPNGHNKARGSLSIAEAGDGRVLLHCFACGDVPGILSSLGLQLADLFPQRIRDDWNPAARKAAIEAFRRSSWEAALRVLDREATVVLIAAGDVHKGKQLSYIDDARLMLAAHRITQARSVLA